MKKENELQLNKKFILGLNNESMSNIFGGRVFWLPDSFGILKTTNNIDKTSKKAL